MKLKKTMASIVKKPVLLGVLGTTTVMLAVVAWSMSMGTLETAVANSSTTGWQSPPPLPLSNEVPRTDDEESPETVTQNPQTNDTEVTVNGQPVEVPPSGNVHQTIRDGSSKTTIDIQVDNGDGSGPNTSSSSMSVEVRSSSSTSTDSDVN